MADRWSRVSESPTHPGGPQQDRTPSAADLFTSPAPAAPQLDERLRQAYFWLVNRAVISPFYDLEFGVDEGSAPTRFTLGDTAAELTLAGDQCYSSHVLLPLLTFAVGGRCLLVGGPGRGKTAIAVCMGVLAGSSAADVRRHVQQGQPQLTVSELVGLPLPKDLVEADRLDGVRVAWRSWLTQPVKIVDEYNRIPTKTQSALLTLVAERYVESYDQVLSTTPPSGVESWFFTANDDSGGGTFPVIQALRDRIDVTVAALGFNHRFLAELVTRVEADERPEEHLPAELVFGGADQAAMAAAIRAIPFPAPVRRRLEFFAGHFEFLQHGGRQFEYRTKDTVMTSGGSVAEVVDRNEGADLQVDIGAQTTAAISVRALQTLIRYAKAMAWFRGAPAVTVADVAAVLPFVLRDKLRPNLQHPRFDTGVDHELSHDVVSWLRDLFTAADAEYTALGLDRDDPVGALLAQAEAGLQGLGAADATRRLTEVEARIAAIAGTGKLYARHFDDLLALKYLHQRYSSYLRWLRTRPPA